MTFGRAHSTPPLRPSLMLLRIKEMLWHADSEPVECVMSLLMAAWGAWLLLPYETFAAMTSYRDLAARVDERVIGLVVLLLAIARLAMVLDNRVRPRQMMAVLSGLVWGGNLGLTWANTSTLLVPIYLVFLVVSVWLAIRLAGRASA